MLRTWGLAAATAVLPFAAHAQAPSWNWDGDVRVRFDNQDYTHAKSVDRLMLRVRMNATGTLADGKVDWGVGLTTGASNPVSPDVVMAGGNISGVANNNKAGDIGFAKAYIGFKPVDRLRITVGKMNNPFWETDGIFCPDLFPEGLALSYVISPGAKGDMFTKVKDTLAWFQVANSSTFTATTWMLGDQISTTAKSGTDLGLGFYYYSGLNAGYVAGKTSSIAAGLDSQAGNQTITVGGVSSFVKDTMGVISGKVRHPFSIGKNHFPLIVSGEVFDNVVVTNQSLGYEARLDMPRFLGNGSFNFTWRQEDSQSTFSPWADSKFGAGTGYHAGLRADYSVPIYKNVTFEAMAFHFDRFWVVTPTPTARSTNRILAQVMAAF
jgi:hypothetical protein